MLEEIRAKRPRLPVIVMTAHSDLESAVAAYQGGAFEYLPKPFDIDQAVELVRRAAAQGQRAETTGDRVAAAFPRCSATRPPMQEMFRAIGRLSRSSMTVLITGESGTGKELVARALHRHSPRAAKPFIALNTSAFTADLLESELFGHEKGAFTGAAELRRGRFEQADGGTLFLDEIGDMSPALQTRLLRVLAEGEFYRVGGQLPVKVDVRVIAATHQDLEARVKDGPVPRGPAAPPQRDPHRGAAAAQSPRGHPGAAAPLPRRRRAIELGVEPKMLAPEAEAALVGFDWPGNVRQLVNACRRLTVTRRRAARSARRHPGGPRRHGVRRAAGGPDWAQALASLGAGALRRRRCAAARRRDARVRAHADPRGAQGHPGRRQEAAKLLGWGRNTLTRKLKELGIETREAGRRLAGRPPRRVRAIEQALTPP